MKHDETDQWKFNKFLIQTCLKLKLAIHAFAALIGNTFPTFIIIIFLTMEKQIGPKVL